MTDHQPPFRDVDALARLSDEELAALWAHVPTERQRAYRSAYEREVRDAGASGTDALELQVARELLRRYRESALIPLGSRWARTPERVREAAESDTPLHPPLTAHESMPSVPPLVIAVALVALLLVIGVFGWRQWSAPATVSQAPTLTPSITPTPADTPTPTPLALEAQDAVIRGGDAAREVAYPVGLQVDSPHLSAPRVWVVQRRTVSAAEWRFDPNPDTAAFVGGMSVRPVLGVPWSPENAAFFAALDAGATFTLTMNTGAVQTFTFSAKRDVRRSETAIFRQVAPGLVLLLIGETGVDGLPTATRMLVTATYPPEQELARDGELIPLAGDFVTLPTPLPTTEAVRFAGVDVQLIDAATEAGRLVTRVRLYNGGSVGEAISAEDVWLALGYADAPRGPRQPALGLMPFTLLPDQAADLTLVWAWTGEPYATLHVAGWLLGLGVGV